MDERSPAEHQSIAPLAIDPGRPVPPMYVEYMPRRLLGYGITGTELDMLRSNYSSKNQAFFGFTSGVAVSALFSLLTGTFAVQTYAFIGAVCFVAAVMAFNFYLRMRDDDKKAGKIIDEIVERQPVAVAVPPLIEDK